MTNFNDIIEEMFASTSASARLIKSLVRDFEQQLTDAIEDLSYEFVDAPDEELAPDDDPNYDIALEIQGRFLTRLIKENFYLDE